MIQLRSVHKASPAAHAAALFFWLLGLVCAAVVPVSAAENFPLYPCVSANVKFWEDIYSRYSTRQGILHDTDDLSLVYGVVDLVDWEAPDAAQLNSDRIKNAKERIIAILTALGSGNPAATPEEKRIAALFPKQRRTSFHQARDNIRLQIGQKDRFYEGLLRSGKYLAHFKQIFADKGLPTDLAYLPHVESSFNPKAYSKAGASGLWQFTRSTGKDYLTINQLVDERADPYLATIAAAQLLQENYAALQSWPLALTAYNYGRAGMVRALREHGSYETIFNSYNQGYFKFASRNFYSEFLAAMRTAKRFESLPRLPLERPEVTSTFRLKESAPLARLLAAIKLSKSEFLRLNPALLDPVADGQQPVPKGYLVRTPAARQPLKSGAAAQHMQAAPPVARNPVATTRYTVRKGDTLSSIAQKFSCSPQAIQAANSGKRLTVVQEGEQLAIPGCLK
jgi:membrane-bound lytic murein transglycosylase D